MVTKDELLKSVLIFDIECFSKYDIRNEFDKYVSDAKPKWIGFYSYKTNQYYEIPVLGNEDLIKNFIKEHKYCVGFNNKEFDTPILRNNELIPKYFRELDMMKILSPIDVKNPDAKARAVYMGYDLEETNLNYIAQIFGATIEKGDIDYKIFEKNSWSTEEIVDIKKYLRRDIELTKFIFEKTVDFFWQFTEWIDQKNVENFSFIASSIAALGYKYVCHVRGMTEDYSDEPEEKTDGGGRVIEPTVDEERDVWYVDVVSMYPHNYMQFLLLNEVWGSDLLVLSDEEKSKLYHGNNIIKVKGYYRIDKNDKLTQDLQQKMLIRTELKKTNPKHPMIYCLKILFNSLYGANRSKKFKNFYTPNSGEDCCYIGRQINEIMEKFGKEAGFSTITADTDSNFWKHSEPKTKEQVKAILSRIVTYIKSNCPNPVDTFNIDIEKHIDYISFVKEEGKTMKKNYFYVYTDKNNEKQVQIMGLPIIKRNGTKLGKIILEKYLIPKIKETISGRFDKKWLLELIQKELEEDITVLAQEYRCASFNSYSVGGRNCLNAQISKNYFNGKSGKIKLIKNHKIGRVGNDNKYCSIEEAKNLTIKDLDFDKIYNELQPFCKDKLDSKKSKQANGFFNIDNITIGISNNSNENINIDLELKRGYFK